MILFLLPSFIPCLPSIAFQMVGTLQGMKETTVKNDQIYFHGNLQSSKGNK